MILIALIHYPADRLVSKDINNRSVTVTVVPGNAATQTIVVFVNRAVTTTQAIPQGGALTDSTSPDNIGIIWPGPREAILDENRNVQFIRLSSVD